MLAALAHHHAAAAIDFASRLVRTPSPSGEERAVADLVRLEMAHLGFDDVQTDAVGNVIGLLRGSDPTAPSLLFNGHMDHVSPGRDSDWAGSPFAGNLRDGRLWGRGATDMKASVACQIHAVGLLAANGLRPAGDVYVAAVVMEEVGGMGSRHLGTTLHPSAAVVGEPTRLHLTRGHRGRVEIWLDAVGRSAHASLPDLGLNPHYALAACLLRLRALPMRSDPVFGASSVVPTLYVTDQTSANVIPSRARVTLDWRNVPAESAADIVACLQPLLDADDAGEAHLTVCVGEDDMVTYNGHRARLPSIFPAFGLPPDHVVVSLAEKALCQALGRPCVAGVSPFATDGGHLMAAGIPTVIFGPGAEKDCHVVNESVALDDIRAALLGNAALALHLAAPRGEVYPGGE